MNSLNVNVASLSLALLLTLAAGFGQQPARANEALGLGGVINGLGGGVITGLGGAVDSLAGGGLVGNVLNTATGMVGGLTGPLMGALGSMSGGLLSQSSLGNIIGGTLGGGGGLVDNSLRLATGAVTGTTQGLTNAIGGLPQADKTNNIGAQMAGVAAADEAAAARSAEVIAASDAAAARSNYNPQMFRPQYRQQFKREAIPDASMMAALAAEAAQQTAGNREQTPFNRMAAGAANFGAAAAEGVASAGNALYGAGANIVGNVVGNVAGNLAAGNLAGNLAAGNIAGNLAAANMGANMAANELSMFNPASQVGPAAAAVATEAGMLAGNGERTAANLAGAVRSGAAMAENAALSQGAAVAQNMASNQATLAAANAALGGRAALAVDAVRNAQAESAAAGAEMVAHGAVNARSASIASNAYRQAKLASARDRVDIAGTIQNSARISDAAIATHDAATKAEDSLLGSELAVDSASTVLDSDAAYIPPVTNSLLRSLPYGRLGLRNIIPKPLTHPSVLLPDVWLNGVPVNYFNQPLHLLPYGIGPAESYASLGASAAAMASGAIINGQPFIANNGLVLNGLVFDPAYAYLPAANLRGIVGSSLAPILANGQLEAQDELVAANSANIKQLNGAGMADTYQGYGRLNPVPMLTGSVSDMTLIPTTTIGTTYPIGSALVIEPRDSYFQGLHRQRLIKTKL